jgi:4-hydroxy-tetrahydrodipicolinate reductase
MRLGVLGKGRLGSAVARAAGAGVAWQVGRGPVPAAPVDVLIDVSSAEAVAEHVDLALARATPLVIGVTGWSTDGLAERVHGRIGVVVAPNLSVTVALLRRFTEVLGRFAAQDPLADPYILEHHHARKKDAPSGTAKLLAAALLAACPRKQRIALPSADRALAPDELCVSPVRAGHTASYHVVGVDAPGETIELVHAARDLSPYAQGALLAAQWILGRKGVYTMADVAADRLRPCFADA